MVKAAGNGILAFRTDHQMLSQDHHIDGQFQMLELG